MSTLKRGLTALGALWGIGILAPGPAAADMGGRGLYHMVAFDELEYALHNASSGPLGLELEAFVGGDWNRIVAKVEGEFDPTTQSGDSEVQLLYSRLIGSFWALRAGLRGDLPLGTDDAQARSHVAIGLEGQTPYRLRLEPTIFLSQGMDVSARLTASYEVYITQRLIAQPEAETQVALQAVPAFEVGRGLNTLDLSLRLRYEFHRQLAPYVGASWERAFGQTRALREAAGHDAAELQGVAGVRLWF